MLLAMDAKCPMASFNPIWSSTTIFPSSMDANKIGFAAGSPWHHGRKMKPGLKRCGPGALAASEATRERELTGVDGR